MSDEEVHKDDGSGCSDLVDGSTFVCGLDGVQILCGSMRDHFLGGCVMLRP